MTPSSAGVTISAAGARETQRFEVFRAVLACCLLPAHAFMPAAPARVGACPDSSAVAVSKRAAEVLVSWSMRMGTSVDQIDRTYGHLLPDAAERTRTALDSFLATDRERKEMKQ
jgi:hypothetical protein